MADLVAGGARREAFLRHLKTEVPRDIRDVVMTGFFAALPLPLASRIGAWLGRKVGESLIRSKGVRLKRIHDNLRLIRPDMPEADYDGVVLRFHEVFGRLLSEMSHMRRLARHMRVEGEHLLASSPDRPLILVGLHTGNWEVVAAKAAGMGMPLASIAIPLPQRARRRIVTRLRTRAGAILIEPNAQGLRKSLALLKAGGRQAIFCDETDPSNRLRAPFFGRAPDPRANLVTAARLARKTDARLVVFHVVRGDGLDLVWKLGPEIALPAAPAGTDQVTADLVAMNAAIEPIVRANVDQWYWLDSIIR